MIGPCWRLGPLVCSDGISPNVAHKLARLSESAKVPDLCCQGYGRHELDTTHCLQCLDQRLQPPALDRLPQPLRSIAGTSAWRPQQLPARHSRRAVAPAQGRSLSDPGPMRVGPVRLARVTPVVAKQEFAQLMPYHTFGVLGVFSRPLEVADRLGLLVRDEYGHQIAGTKIMGQLSSVTRIGLDSFGRSSWGPATAQSRHKSSPSL